MPNDDYSLSIAQRLDAILRLLLERQRERDPKITTGDQLLLLQDCGLSSSESGSILGIKSNQVASYVRFAKKKQLKEKVSRKKSDRNAKQG